MEAVSKIVLDAIDPCVNFLESLSFLGVNTHFVKSAYLVSIPAAFNINCIDLTEFLFDLIRMKRWAESLIHWVSM